MGIEILAPAGSEEALRAAVYTGADAVYLAGKMFGARAGATNFNAEELQRAIRFAHLYGVQVYVTVNTLIKEEEVQPALDFIQLLCELSVDAVLIQDIGLLRLIRLAAPNLPVHASTQMSLMGEAGLTLAATLGLTRAVLPRELSFAEMKALTRHTQIDLEVFVHGALCMSVSGQCYFSSALGDRSGNRGRCAQPCRLPMQSMHAKAIKETKYEQAECALSLKDLSILAHLPELEAIGIRSAKIEGRMKRPEYVAAAVSACKEALNAGDVSNAKMAELEAIFSRSGFTEGHFIASRDSKMFGMRTRENVQHSGKILADIQSSQVKERKIAVELTAWVSSGKVYLSAKDAHGNFVQSNLPAMHEIDAFLSHQRCIQQLSKTGGTVFSCSDVIAPKNGLPLRISDINQLRRMTLDKLADKLVERKKIPFCVYPQRKNLSSSKTKSMMGIRAQFTDLDQITEAASALEVLYVPLDVRLADCVSHPLRDKMVFALPRALFGVLGQEEARKALREKRDAGFQEFACYNLDALAICNEEKVKAHGLFSMNLTNSSALSMAQELGLNSVELSPELSGREWTNLSFPQHLRCGAMVYGRLPLMLTRVCPIRGSGASCEECKRNGYLRDRKGVEFPVICNGAKDTRYVEILNSVATYLPLEIQKTIDFGLLRFTVENSKETELIITSYLQGKTLEISHTKRSFRNGVE